MAIQEVISKDEIKEHKTKVQELSDQMSAITVTSKEELTTVAGHIGRAKEIKKIVTQARDKYIAPAKQIIDQAKADFNPIIDMCDEVEEVLKKKAQDFLVAEQKKEDDQKAKILNDKRTSVDTKVEKISEVQEADTKIKTEAGTLGMKMVDEVVIVDQSLIPEEYYKPRELDMVKIKKVATAGVAIPGVKVEKKPQMAMRSK